MNSSANDSITHYDVYVQELNKAWDKTLSVEVILLSLFIVIALVSLIVAYEVYRSNKTKQKLQDIAWEKFHEHVNYLRLSGDNITMLRNIARIASLQDPYSIVKSPHIFENCIELFYNKERISSMSNDTLVNIRNLRKALGFLPLSREIAYTSTRQFDSGDRCAVVVLSNGQPSHKGMCLILSVNEKTWTIDRPEGPAIAEGTAVKIDFTRPGDAEYSFETKVLSDSKGGLVLSHTGKLKRTQQRNWVRVDVSIPVEVMKSEKDHVSDIFSGKIIDMSGGGFGMTLPSKLATGTILILDFELPGHGQISDLMVKVVRVAGHFKNNAALFVHSVAFEGDVSKIQEQIMQYVFEKQRQDILMAKRG